MRVVPVALLVACRIETGPPDVRAACDDDEPTGEVWIYTSMYQSVIDEVDPQVRARFPGLEPRWFQAGSEKVAQRVETEWEAGGSKACLLMTSDPFWYAELAARGRLEPHLPPNVLHVDRGLADADGYWVTSRISLMVLAANELRLEEGHRPVRFGELADPRWRDRVTMGDPLASGTMFTTIAFFDASPGPAFIDSLRANGLVASGGNSSVLTRLETGERDVGVLLLENVLTARRKGSPVVAVFPEDGAIAVPGPIALTVGCPNPAGAIAVYDYLLSEDGQRAIVNGDMYSALPELPPPTDAPALSRITVREWAPGFADDVAATKAELKDRWAAPVQPQ